MTNRQRTILQVLAILLGFVLIAAACGDDGGPGGDTDDGDDTDEGGDDEDTDTDEDTDGGGDDGDGDVVLTDSAHGVTADTINVGVTMLDFDLLVERGLSPAGWGDQIAVHQALFDHINDNGGINGRRIHAEYELYSPISATSADEVCNKLLLDFELFAIIGGFLGPAGGTSDPCITGLNNTILIGGEMNAEELAASNAPWYHVAPSVEEQTTILLDLLEENGYTDGVSVYAVGGVAAEAQFDFVVNELSDRAINVVGDAILGAGDGDTVDQDNEMGPIMERLSQSGADTVFIFGNPAAIIRGIADAELHTQIDIWTNNAAGLNNLGRTITDLSVADGVLTSGGLTDTEIWDQPLYQSECSEVVSAAVPDAVIKPPTEYGREEENWFNAIRIACQDIHLFRLIADAAGPDLTPESFVTGANSLGKFEMPIGPESSFEEGKITARDLERLLVYDSTVGDGGTRPLTDLVNKTE